MDGEKDSQLEDIIEKNRQALNKLRSLTEDLEAVVEYEKRFVDDLADPLLIKRQPDEAST